MTPAVRVLLLYAQMPANETISYQLAWPRHFLAHERFRCTAVNVVDAFENRAARVRARVMGRRYDAVLVLHSVFSNGNFLQGRLFDAVRRLPAVKAYFIGNEYKGMPEKMRFCESLDIRLLVSQFTDEPPLALYRERLPATTVIGIPSAGWDPVLFSARVPPDERPIDLGYRAFDNDMALGHRERRDVAERFAAVAGDYDLRVDVSLDPGTRYDERAWGDFLNRCKGQLGTEAGGDYFELTDETRERVNAYVDQHPGTTFAEVHERFFAAYGERVTGRSLSSRVVEAAGTKTVQILLEGEYGGYFEPDRHYIRLAKDFSNLDEVIAKFREEGLREQIREEAFRLVAQELTYARLIDRFHEALAPLL